MSWNVYDVYRYGFWMFLVWVKLFASKEAPFSHCFIVNHPKSGPKSPCPMSLKGEGEARAGAPGSVLGIFRSRQDFGEAAVCSVGCCRRSKVQVLNGPRPFRKQMCQSALEKRRRSLSEASGWHVDMIWHVKRRKSWFARPKHPHLALAIDPAVWMWSANATSLKEKGWWKRCFIHFDSKHYLTGVCFKC